MFRGSCDELRGEIFGAAPPDEERIKDRTSFELMKTPVKEEGFGAAWACELGCSIKNVPVALDPAGLRSLTAIPKHCTIGQRHRLAFANASPAINVVRGDRQEILSFLRSS
jgi:hypothetical protein